MSAARATTPARPRRRLSWAAWLIAIGLLIEVISLIWSHPTAFLLFLAPGAVLVAAGVLLFLWEIVNYRVVPPEEDEEPEEKQAPAEKQKPAAAAAGEPKATPSTTSD